MKLQEIRLQRGLTQKELAEMTNIPLRTIQQYESGSRRIDGASLSYLCKLSDALCVNIYDILEDDGLAENLKETT